MNVLLDYFFKINSITPSPAASTAFLKQVAVVVAPNAGGSAGALTECTSAAQVAVVTDNTEVNELFNAGMSKIHVIQAADLDLATILATHGHKFFTLLISSDFDEADFASLDKGTWDGVIGVYSNDDTFLSAQAIIEKQCAFYGSLTNKAKNMMYAFGKLLSNSVNWANQQYITMPYDDGITALGDAEGYFDDKVSFVLTDTLQYGKRLSLFAAGGQAIAAPYIKKNLEIDLQGKALSFVSGNQPSYTIKNATLLEDELDGVIDSYISRGWIELGNVDIKLEADNFEASGYINISEPKALWRILGEIRQTL